MHRMMILVCHAADGHFADGNRSAVQQVLDGSASMANLSMSGLERYLIACMDGGQLELYAPGLSSHRSFHRIDLFLESESWTPDVLDLLFELMSKGGFGLVENLDFPQFIVTHPQQVSYFPWLPQPPLLVRSARDLAYSIGQVA